MSPKGSSKTVKIKVNLDSTENLPRRRGLKANNGYWKKLSVFII